MKMGIPVEDRAGTRLDHLYTKVIRFRRDGEIKEFGTLDVMNRVYQFGGHPQKHIYRMRDFITLGIDEFDLIKDYVDWIEFIDHVKNICYRIHIDDAMRLITTYNGPRIGLRYGIPRKAFTVYDKDWNVIT